MTVAQKAAKAPEQKLMIDKRNDQRFIINIPVGGEQDDPYVFIGGMSAGDMRIKRGVDVEVPYEVIERLDNAVVGRPTREIDTKTGDEKVAFIEAKRFPYTIVGVVGQ